MDNNSKIIQLTERIEGASQDHRKAHHRTEEGEIRNSLFSNAIQIRKKIAIPDTEHKKENINEQE